MDLFLGVNGGSSETRISIHPVSGTDVNVVRDPVVVGPAGSSEAALALAEMIGEALSLPRASGVVGVGVFALAALHILERHDECVAEFDKALREIEALRSAELWFMNDVVPLVVGDPGKPRIGVVAGTGTAYAATDGEGRWARASGLDCFMSDEGAGFDIGLSGLRAAVSSHDGRGPVTKLEKAARDEFGSLDRFSMELARSARPKALVAAFARTVLETCLGGDGVAEDIVRRSAESIWIGIDTVHRAIGGPVVGVRFEGGIVRSPDSPVLAHLLEKFESSGKLHFVEDDLDPAGRALRVALAPGSSRAALLGASPPLPVSRRVGAET